jgi:hypothetical protein
MIRILRQNLGQPARWIQAFRANLPDNLNLAMFFFGDSLEISVSFD